ncbi:MAG: electron transfer flavoprotein subunit beta/FixA family protein [Dehalococcoidia bacterium]|nr:electron transfer flavoprotein subunit beta/FixA family protein [Dehalococcoidia bacterium]
MNIVVCVKQVPDTNVPLEPDPRTKSVKSDDVVWVVNPYDLLAVEAAVRLKETHGGEVTLLSLGQPEAKMALKSCLALGADKAFLLFDPAFNDSDSYAAGVTLSRAISAIPHDLVLCGAQSSDTNAGLAGAVIAENLGLPLVSGVTHIEASPESKRLIVHRKLERGNREVIETVLPAVLTIESGINEPRYASLPSLMAGLRKEIEVQDMKKLGLALGEVGAKGCKTKVLTIAPPRPRPKRLFTPDSSLSAAERMRLVMSGGLAEKSGDVLQGNPKEVAAKIIQFLKKEKIVEG